MLKSAVFFFHFERFTGGVTHSFTGSAEDRDKLLSFHNMYIGENATYTRHLHQTGLVAMHAVIWHLLATLYLPTIVFLFRR